jgi:hypothetical protein
VRYEVGNGSRILFWQVVWCGELPLKNVFLVLFTIACANEAWVEENMVIVNGVIHWNVMFIQPINDWEMEEVHDFSNCCILNKLGMVGWIKFVGFY